MDRAERLRTGLRAGGRRLRASWAQILQCGLAAGAAWWVAADLVGHALPFFAPVAAVITLGMSLANRLRRVVELVVGVSLGVLIGDLIVAGIGTGPWQIAVVVALALAVAVFADGGTLLVNQAGASAVLVAALVPAGQAGGLDRCLDALIGGAVGVAVAAVLPTDPVVPVRRAARTLLAELVGVLDDVADALRRRDLDAAGAALRRSRASQPLVDQMRAVVRGGREATAIAPLVRRRRGVLGPFAELAERTDYATRNARGVARQAWAVLGDGEPATGELSDVLAELSAAVEVLAAQVGAEGDRTRARAPVVDAVRHAKALADGTAPTPGPAAQALLAHVRSLGLDLLQATGMTRDEALAAMHGPP